MAWTVCGILTAAGAFTDYPNKPGYRARTDARASAVTDIPFFYFPYPCTCDIILWVLFHFHEKKKS